MKQLKILSENELTTRDITEMNDYFDLYIDGLKNSLSINSIDPTSPISPADIAIMNEIASLGANLSMKGDVLYLLDFDSLPKEIKEGLSTGKYKMGESRQVDGNLRATIVDSSTGTRVKDVTIKEIQNNSQNAQTITNLMTQLQMKQITERLDALCDMSKYMIKRHRDRDLIEPFFTARNLIGDAQVAKDENEQKYYLFEASRILEKLTQSGYQYMITDAQFLERKTHAPLLMYKDKDIRLYMGYICEDLYMVNKSIGLNMQIYNYLGKMDEAKNRIKEYIEAMYVFAQKTIPGTKRTTIEVLQDNYPYKKENKDMWIYFGNNIIESHDEMKKLNEMSHTYLISAEVGNDESL